MFSEIFRELQVDSPFETHASLLEHGKLFARTRDFVEMSFNQIFNAVFQVETFVYRRKHALCCIQKTSWLFFQEPRFF